jgi:nucleosome assembly protein 1-like 1
MAIERVQEMTETLDALVKLDDVYAGIEKELREKVSALRREYEPKLAAVLKDRETELSKGEKGAKSTPGIPRFWLEVLSNSEEFGQDIEEYDEPVLEYLDSIEAADIDPTDEDKGFVITFKFTENPFFSNTEVRKTYTTVRSNEFTDQLEIVRIESDKIDWLPGKDVTVEVVAKKKSGGGARKKKSAAKAEPRPSFFRFFRDLDIDNFPSEMGDDEDDEEEEEHDELDRLQMFMQDDWERAASLKDLVIPRAVRWYTGEAVDADYEEDDEDDEDDDDEDDEDESEDESESDEPVKKNLFAQKGANQEECKQQ